MSEWRKRSRTYGLRTETWFEREKPGCPGVLERVAPEVLAREQTRSSPAAQPRLSAVRALEHENRALRLTEGSRSAYRVWISADVRRQLLRQELEAGIETGGALYGGRNGHEIWIADAIIAVEDASSRDLILDGDYIDRMTERHRRFTGWQLVGTHHTHPTSRSRAEPSHGDLISWTSYYRHGGERPFVGMILAAPEQEAPAWAWGTPLGRTEEGSWGHPQIGAFIVESGGGEPLIRWAADFEVEQERHPEGWWRR